ncbi:MAG: glycosyltransferase family 4 protein [Candidatus Latescibacteria bacterium]|nr:glycosyltransferase family 4 protein [Candidatus Latescibacterota bacterium]
MTTLRKRILFIQPNVRPPGGAEALAAWMIEALKDEYDLTLLTWTPVDLTVLNRFYGTSLGPSEFEICFVPSMIRHIVNLIPDRWAMQRNAVLMRWCKSIRNRYDLLLSASNEIDFGGPGIQYIHYPYQELNWSREPRHQRGMARLISFIKTRIRPWRIISGFSFDRMLKNKTLANSEWTRGVIREVYGLDATTVYPPVPGCFPEVPWEKKEIGFVCIGRLATDKRFEELIDILMEVRTTVPEIHLHIIGSSVEYDRDCYERVRKKVEENEQWVFLHEDVSREKLTDLVCRHRYGIHGLINEHFGIAVAEMMRGGCIVFAPDSGGQVEILGNEERLLYHTAEDAARKIVHVLSQPEVETEIRDQLELRKDLYTVDQFTQRIREVVGEFLADGV